MPTCDMIPHLSHPCNLDEQEIVDIFGPMNLNN